MKRDYVIHSKWEEEKCIRNELVHRVGVTAGIIPTGSRIFFLGSTAGTREGLAAVGPVISGFDIAIL
jgi:hypothetical protein